MRAIVTGQIGLEKKPFLDAIARFAGQQGETLSLYHVGDMMYAEGTDVRAGRILDLPISRLNSLRRAAFKDIIAESSAGGPGDGPQPNIIVNTHATFRWRHGLFAAFDYDQVQKLQPDIFICLVDNIEVVHHRLHREHDVDATLKDCMVWREEEILATELLAKSIPNSKFYIMARGRHALTTRMMYRLICRPNLKKVYPSFPMSHVMDMPEIMADIDRFRAALAEHFITFDPGDVDEKLLLDRAIVAAREGKEFLDIVPHTFGGSLGSSSGGLPGGPALRAGSLPEPIRVRVREVLDIAGDIDGQIYMRDFKLVDQADMIVSYIPEIPDGKGGGIPGLSSGVERELHHAFEHTKEVFVVWKPKKPPSPFITETATRIFASVDEALTYFEKNGYFGDKNLFGN